MNLAYLPDTYYPSGEATNKLASLRAKAVKAKVLKPFPLMETAEFLPSWADDTNPDSEEGDEKKKSKKNKLDMVRWVSACHARALAADAAEVYTFVHLSGCATFAVCNLLCRCGCTPARWHISMCAWRLLPAQRLKASGTASQSSTTRSVARNGI